MKLYLNQLANLEITMLMSLTCKKYYNMNDEHFLNRRLGFWLNNSSKNDLLISCVKYNLFSITNNWKFTKIDKSFIYRAIRENCGSAKTIVGLIKSIPIQKPDIIGFLENWKNYRKNCYLFETLRGNGFELVDTAFLPFYSKTNFSVLMDELKLEDKLISESNIIYFICYNKDLLSSEDIYELCEIIYNKQILEYDNIINILSSKCEISFVKKWLIQYPFFSNPDLSIIICKLFASTIYDLRIKCIQEYDKSKFPNDASFFDDHHPQSLDYLKLVNNLIFGEATNKKNYLEEIKRIQDLRKKCIIDNTLTKYLNSDDNILFVISQIIPDYCREEILYACSQSDYGIYQESVINYIESLF
jgi:hypothetical protein